MRREHVLLLASLVITACRRSPVGHQADDDHAAGKHAHEESKSDHPTRSVTVWTERSELFLEHPAFVVGQPAELVVHLTVLAGWKPLTKGGITANLKMSDGATIVAAVPSPNRPGIFTPTLKPTRAGACTLEIVVEGSGTERIAAGACEVYATTAAAKAVAPVKPAEGSDEGAFSFLKEQQWQTELTTEPVAERDLQPTVRLTGQIKAVSAREAHLAAAAPGRIQLGSPAPVLGMEVRKGQVLAVLLPRLAGGTDRASLEAELRVARAEAGAAQAQLARAERLFGSESVPRKAVEEARAAAEVAHARATGAQGRLAQQTATARGAGGGGAGAFQVRAPLAGTLAAVDVASGESVQEGKDLFTVIDLTQVWLEARVFEPDIAKVEGARAGWFWLEGYAEPFAFGPPDAKLVTLGRVLDPQTRSVPLIFEIQNTAGKFRVGQFAKVDVATGAQVRALAIPASAIVEEGGKSVAYVQTEGESFARRPLVVTTRSAGWVAVRQGLRAGERVVTKGAYDVKLAASAGATPGHGHSH